LIISISDSLVAESQQPINEEDLLDEEPRSCTQRAKIAEHGGGDPDNPVPKPEP
jgi:hypothetical protein